MTDVQQAVPVAQEKAYRFAGEVSNDATSHLAIRSPLNRVIYKAVRDYRLSNMAYADDQGGAYPLVDLMSNPAPSDIGTGEMEMISLVDEIQMAIEAAGMSLPLPCKSGEGAEAIVRDAATKLLAAVDTRNMRGRNHVPSMRDEQTARARMAKALALTPDATQTREAEGVSVDDALAFADKIAEQHRQRANDAEARIKAAIDCMIQPGEGWQEYSLRLRAALNARGGA